jgi:hypothetical protein
MSISLPNVADRPFYEELLRRLGAPVTDNTLGALYAWRQAEGGKAAYNPFNTTQRAEGSTSYNSVGVQNYTSPEQGVTATVKTLTNGRYEQILSALRANLSPEEIGSAIVASPWGTSNLVLSVVSMYRRGKVVVAPIAAAVGGLPAYAVSTTKRVFSQYGWVIAISGLAITGAIIWRVRRSSR